MQPAGDSKVRACGLLACGSPASMSENGPASGHAGRDDRGRIASGGHDDRGTVQRIPAGGQVGPDAQRHAGICHAGRGYRPPWLPVPAGPGVAGGLCHGDWSRVPPLSALT
jgi:hypothetical protein